MLKTELTRRDPAIGRLIEDDFIIVGTNDGDLAAHAAASVIGEGKYGVVGDVILGSGVGGAVVTRDPDGIYRPINLPFEIGHVVHGDEPTESYENTFSGTALAKITNFRLHDLLFPKWDDRMEYFLLI